MRMTVLVAAACAILCSGCASIVTGNEQSLSVVTSSDGNDVEGAKCALSNDKGSWFVTSPGSVTVRRSINDLTVSCTLDGHAKAEQPVKSTTKGMVAGNVLIGGVIGIGVDIASGAAFDYPNVIAIVMTRIGSGAGAGSAPAAAASSVEATAVVAVATPSAAVAAPANVPVALRPGVRLTFLDRDAISQVPVGETTLALVEATSTQRIYNEGSLITALDGTPVKGSAHAVMIYGVGPRELARGGTWSGMYRAANVMDDVPATFTVLRRQTKVVSGHLFEATRIRIQGYATRSGIGGQVTTGGAAFTGEALVDNASGLVLELEVACRHNGYAVRRELVRVSGSG